MCAYLDAKIVASRKTATYWDAYNVRGTITNVNDFDQSVASLSNSSSYIIDCDAFSRGGVNYTRGDAILKDFYGNLIHIPSTQTGYYLPSAISAVSNSPGVYAITFDYVEGSTRPLSDQHILPIETTEVESGVIYNLLKTLAPGEGYELTLILVDGVIVKPL